MHFENRLPPEGINVGKIHPLAELLRLSVGVFGLVAVFTVAAYLAASFGAQWLPFSIEKLVADIWLEQGDPDTSASQSETEPELEDEAAQEAGRIEAQLQALADALAPLMDFPEGITVTIHYVDNDTVNALATLGGHIYVFRGLVDRLPHENALAMVLAHEMAHIRHRDPIRHLAGAVVVGLVIDGLLSTRAGLASALISGAGDLIELGYSRDAERAADAAALRAVWRRYGHVGGAADLFEVFNNVDDPTERRALAFLRSHPLKQDRIDAVGNTAGDGTWPTEGPLTPLPWKSAAGSLDSNKPE